jgi:hypothetical protein
MVKQNAVIPSQMKEATQNLLCSIHKEAVVQDCYNKLQTVKTLLKDSSLLPSTRKHIKNLITLAEEKKNQNKLGLEEVEDIKNDMKDLPMPVELKIALAGLIGSLAALALLTAASMTVVPVVAVGIVSLGGGTLGLFRSLNGQQQVNSVMEVETEKKEEEPSSTPSTVVMPGQS